MVTTTHNGRADIDLDLDAPANPLAATWRGIRIRIHPDISPEEAARLFLEVLGFAAGLTYPVSLARMDEARCEQEHKRERNNAFRVSSAASDKKKEADAQANPLVQIAEAKQGVAENYRKLLEEMRSDAMAYHYALRGIAKMTSEDQRLA